MFVVLGGLIQRAAPWSLDGSWKTEERMHWDPEEIAEGVEALVLPTNDGRDTGILRQ